MDCSTPGFPVLHHLPEFAQIHKFMSIESVMLSNHLNLCRPLLLLPSVFSSNRVFSNELVLHIRWPKYWSFSLSISTSNGYSGLIFLGLTSPCCLRDSQESSLASQFESINSLALSLLYGPTRTLVHDYWKSNSFDYTDFCQQSDVSAF